MDIAVVNSKTDLAGCNIRRHLLKIMQDKCGDKCRDECEDKCGNKCRDECGVQGSEGAADEFFLNGTRIFFYEASDRLIFEESIDKKLNADMIVFISRHSSQKPVPVLTVHAVGNYSSAALGGNPHELSYAAPVMMHMVLNAMNERIGRLDGFSVTYEVTHHGPSNLEVPCFFAEIGSTETEWINEDAGQTAAESVFEGLDKYTKYTKSAKSANQTMSANQTIQENSGTTASYYIKLAGFGGTHYAARQTEIALSSGGAFGHIMHTREAAKLTSADFAGMVEKTGADAAYIDKKSLNAQELHNIEGLIAESGMPVLSEGEIIAASHIPFADFLAMRTLCSSPEAGGEGAKLRCGTLRVPDLDECDMTCAEKGAGHELCIVKIDEALFEEAFRLDARALEEGLSDVNAAGVISKTGKILPVFICYKEIRQKITEHLIAICVKIIHIQKCTSADGDFLIIRKVRFDPKRAAELGVPKGPLFGKLAAGCEIVCEGIKITPDMVSSTSETKIRVMGLEKYL